MGTALMIIGGLLFVVCIILAFADRRKGPNRRL